MNPYPVLVWRALLIGHWKQLSVYCKHRPTDILETVKDMENILSLRKFNLDKKKIEINDMSNI